LAEKGAQGEWTLPDGWVEAPVSEIAELLRGVSYKKAVARETPEAGYLPILRATNIQDNRLILGSDLVYVPEEHVKPEQRLQVGDVVICMSSGSKHLVGKTAQLSREWDGSFGAFCAAARFETTLDRRFIGYFFGSTRYRNLVRERSSGVNINNLRRGDIETLIFPIPPLAEQRRIAAEIETQFTRLDASVAALERAQANIRRYKASVLQAACEGRLVPTEAELARAEGRAYEPADQLLARILAERRAKWETQNPGKRYKEPAPPDREKLSEAPEGWVWASVAQLAESIQYGYTESAKDDPVGPKFLRITDIQDGHVNWDTVPYCKCPEEKHDKYRLEPGDIVFARTGATTGKSYLIVDCPDAVFASYLIRLQMNESLNVKYLALFLDSPSYWPQIMTVRKGSAQPGVNATILATLHVPLPPRPEQSRIVAEVERRLSLVAALEASVAAALARARRLRQAVLKQAFEGRLVPQDPDDEPASALLARIRAQRERAPTTGGGKRDARQMRLPAV
jgi:type I restriction enzyme S subunit